jgi:hypothetical protein
MGCVPHNASVFDKECLRRFMPHAESLGDCIRDTAIFDHAHSSTSHAAGAFNEAGELFVGLHADSALRAMLENYDGIGFRPLQKVFEITIFLYV